MKTGYYSDALHKLVPFVQFKKVKNTHGGKTLLQKLHASACNFTKSITPLWMFFTFFNCTNGTKSCKASDAILRNIHKNTVSPCERGIFIRRTTTMQTVK